MNFGILKIFCEQLFELSSADDCRIESAKVDIVKKTFETALQWRRNRGAHNSTIRQFRYYLQGKTLEPLC